MTIFVLLIGSLLLTQFVNVKAQKSALCYLSYRPEPELLEFAQVLAEDAIKYDVEIFIMVDDMNFNISAINGSSSVRLLQISSETCLRHNYHKAINSGGKEHFERSKRLNNDGSGTPCVNECQNL